LALAKYTYELVRDFCKLPEGQSFGLVSRVAADAQDRIYVFQRKGPPVVVFDRDGKYLGAWGSGEVTDPHGLKIVGEVVYTTDRFDSVAKSFTLDGKVLLELGTLGQHSGSGNVTNWLAERAAGPLNHPTEMIAHPNGDLYVTDGYRNARVYRGKDGNFYIAEREDAGNPAYVCVRDKQGNVLARMKSRHVHGVGVDSKGDIYAGLTQGRSVDKFVLVG